jgi:PKD repeat protein
VKYSISPFVDLSKNNPFYYCIAYAADKKIVQGYTLNTAGKWECQDGGIFQNNPFCEKNKTTRIEAVAMLLRQANLWNDELNKTVSKTRDIRGVSDYWYGYASKGIDAGILSLRANNTILPDEYVTRGEFANMAAKMLSYNQCIKAGTENILAGAIGIVDQGWAKLNQSVFSLSDIFSLTPIINNDINTYRYEWKAIDSITGKIVTGVDSKFLWNTLGTGNWYIELSIIDKNRNEILSSPSTTVTISDGKPLSGNSGTPAWNGAKSNINNGINGVIVPSITLSVNPLVADIGKKIEFSTYAIGTGPLSYNWDFWDGTRSTSNASTGASHIYGNPGTYTVTVTMNDANGKTAQTSIILEVNGDIDTDSDGVADIYDVCPSIPGSKENKWCPLIVTNNYTKWIDTGMAGNNVGIGIGNTSPSVLIDTTKRISSSISIVWKDNQDLRGTTFSKWQYFDLVPVVGSPWSYSYSWKAIDSVTGKIVTVTESHLLGSLLSAGNWYVSLSTTDKNTGALVSTASTTVTIWDGSSLSSGVIWSGNGITSTGIWASIAGSLYPSLTLNASALNVSVGNTIDFSTLTYGVWPFSYTWDFWDGTRLTIPKWSISDINQSHTYTTPGIYTVKVSMTDADGKTVQSHLTIRIVNNISPPIGSRIDTVDIQWNPISKTSFKSTDLFSLVAVTSPSGDYSYSWTATDTVTGKVVTGIGTTLEWTSLTTGNWSVLLSIKDDTSGTIIGTPRTTITISDGSSQNGVPAIGWIAIPSVNLNASTLATVVGGSIDFSTITSGVGPLTYTWNFGDGSPQVEWWSTLSHVFSAIGSYAVLITVTDTTGKTAQSNILIRISDKDSDGDNTTDTIDVCPSISWPPENKWCPFVTSLLGDLDNNKCLVDKAKAQWLIIASPVCTQCPCTNSISFSAKARSCDILFPAILSLDLQTVYSRGGFYQLP